MEAPKSDGAFGEDLKTRFLHIHLLNLVNMFEMIVTLILHLKNQIRVKF